jgi:hypothetical protein
MNCPWTTISQHLVVPVIGLSKNRLYMAIQPITHLYMIVLMGKMMMIIFQTKLDGFSTEQAPIQEPFGKFDVIVAWCFEVHHPQ